MKKKIETINGVDFEVVNAGTQAAQGMVSTYNYYVNRHGVRDINAAYKTPSATKRGIYNDWNAFAAEMGTQAAVLGACSNFFTVGIKTGDRLMIITKSHNKVVNI